MSSRPRILVADDDPDLLSIVAETLEYRGAEIVRAHTGAELVLALAHQSPFDLVVTDINMPWMDGLEAMRSVRYAGVTAPIIFITGSSDNSLPERIAALGTGAMLLHKPVDLEELSLAAYRMLNKDAPDAERK